MINVRSIRNKRFFRLVLLEWNKMENRRIMPWKNETDPYKIWISEIILQQTRVQQGMGYYQRFINKYPTVETLAVAPENDVFKLWEGLGYYSRCRNIVFTAKYIVNELNGVFPNKFEQILQLKGIGNYTASAIASFAYNLPYAVVDGNVFRVLSRFFGINERIDNFAGKEAYSSLATILLDKGIPGIYNQAIMDFGATICTPKPLCEICPLRLKCVALINGIVNKLPVKQKVAARRKRWFYYLLISYRNMIYVRKRTNKDIWQNLHEFVLLEIGSHADIHDFQVSLPFKNVFGSVPFGITSVSGIHTQQLTHQVISGYFIRVKVQSPLAITGYNLVAPDQLSLLPFPKFITAYLKD